MYFFWGNGCPQWIPCQKSSSASSKVSIWNNFPVFPICQPSTQAAAQAQDHIGWINLLLGQLATEWSNLQHYHMSSISSCHTLSSWATGVVTHLLAISHSLWVFHNQVVHDWTMDGTAHAVELQVAEDLHAQFALGLQDLPFSE